MPTRNINLTDHLDQFVDAEVGSGRYSNASEVIREGLRLMEIRKRQEQAKLKWLRGAVQPAIEEVDRGEAVEIRSLNELHDHIDHLRREASTELARKKRRA